MTSNSLSLLAVSADDRKVLFSKDLAQKISFIMITRLTRTFKIATKDVAHFGAIVGDSNPVHVDPDFAAKTRFKSPIAHGMTSLIFMNQMMPEGYKVDSFTIRFMKPIYPGYELTSELVVEGEEFEMLVGRGEEKITNIKGKLIKKEKP